MSSTPLPSRKHCTLEGHRGPVNIVKYANKGTYCMSGGQDKDVCLWNTERGQLIRKYTGHGRHVQDIAITMDNAMFASCGGDRSVFLWDVSTGATITRLSGHTQRIECICFNMYDNVLISGSFDATVRIWDLRAHPKNTIQILDEPKDCVTTLDVSDHEILVSSVDGCIRIYDIRAGKLITDVMGDPVGCAKFSGDGQSMLVQTLNSKIRLLDKESGTLLNTYTGHTNTEYRLRCTFTRMDTHIVSGSEDGAVVCWDILEEKPKCRLLGHRRTVSCVTSHPKEPKLVSASFDGTLIVWH